MLNQETVKRLFNYNELTGELSFVETKGKGKRKDKKVGCLSKMGYLVVWADNKLHQSHRLIWLYYYGCFPKNGIDHINGDKLDNRIKNLRDVTQWENTKNRRKAKNNTSGFNGVWWVASLNKWRARITVNRKLIYLGCFTKKSEAISARKNANIQYGFHDNHGI